MKGSLLKSPSLTSQFLQFHCWTSLLLNQADNRKKENRQYTQSELTSFYCVVSASLILPSLCVCVCVCVCFHPSFFAWFFSNTSLTVATFLPLLFLICEVFYFSSISAYAAIIFSLSLQVTEFAQGFIFLNTHSNKVLWRKEYSLKYKSVWAKRKHAQARH